MSLFAVQPSPGKGRGFFAVVNIPAGTRILCEDPVLTDEHCSPIGIYQKFLHLNSHHPDLANKYFELGHIGHLPAIEGPRADGPRSTTTTRMDVYTEIIDNADWMQNASGRPMRILQPQHRKQAVVVYAIFVNKCLIMRDSTSTGNVHGVFLNSSLINHSCYPNCFNAWNDALRKYCIHASQDIKAGEELLAMYNVKKLFLASREVRLRDLQMRSGFDCNCLACDISTDSGKLASRRKVIAQLAEQVQERVKLSGATSKGVDVAIERLLGLLEEVGLEFLEKCVLHIRLAKIYALSRVYKSAVDHLYRAKLLALKLLGEDNNYTKMIEALRNRMVLSD